MPFDWKGLALVLLLAGLCGDVPLLAQATRGSLQGTVVGDDGVPLSARISASVALAEATPTLLKPVLPPIATGPIVAATVSGTDGSFRLTGLPAGKLAICAQALGYLDPCHWSARLPSVTLTPAQAVTGFKLTLQKGSVLSVRLNDPTNALQPIISSSALPPLVSSSRRPLVVVGVIGPMGLLMPAVLASQDVTGYVHQMTVPLDMHLRLMIAAPGLSMLNAQGAAIDPKGYVIRFVHPSGQDNSAPIVFRVAGRTP